MPFNCKSMFRLQAIARKLLGKIFSKSDKNIGYWVRRKYLSSFSLCCTMLWLFSDQNETAVSQKFVRHDSVSTKP